MTQPHSLWHGAPLVLASASPTRRLLLESAGIPVVVRPALIDERALERQMDDHLPGGGVDARRTATALARAKALAVVAPGALVLGADQTLSLDGHGLHKPATTEAARHQIAALAGRTHDLNSAFALVRDGSVVAEAVWSARLTMRPLSPAFIALYVDAMGEAVAESVGGYKLEGLGIHLFERIEGDQSTILGLPLLPLLAALRQCGVLDG
ncbi:Maf family protein [Lichenihabitans sp. PAMC28606]|uniref:Maf family protein n=1 Tax=Lichenihabitans sp. PAMC28606 TaxID=2880932 RepID=UPI001D0ADF92|nr:Maf family protein [Lichenihabitans sp. PAMC28606]UDL93536.1 Maf family protein [Lichenihabitans sp. PAMC28606]